MDELELSDEEQVAILIDAWNAGNDIARDALRRWAGWHETCRISLGWLLLHGIDQLNVQMKKAAK